MLFGVWQILQFKKSQATGRAAVLASVVSSRMLKAVAEAEGVEYFDTLTGTPTIFDPLELLSGVTICLC